MLKLRISAQRSLGRTYPGEFLAYGEGERTMSVTYLAQCTVQPETRFRFLKSASDEFLRLEISRVPVSSTTGYTVVESESIYT